MGERFDTETNDGAVLQIGSGDRTPSSGQEVDRDMFQQTMIMIMREVHLTIQIIIYLGFQDDISYKFVIFILERFIYSNFSPEHFKVYIKSLNILKYFAGYLVCTEEHIIVVGLGNLSYGYRTSGSHKHVGAVRKKK